MSNPHRGDTPITVGGIQYTLCFDLNACAAIMDHFKMKHIEELATIGNDMSLGMRDIIYMLWQGLMHHHSEMTEAEVGSIEWDIVEMAPLIAEAFQRGLMRKNPPKHEKKVVARREIGTGS